MVDSKSILKVAAIGAVGYGVYRLLKGDKPATVVKKEVSKVEHPVETVKEVVAAPVEVAKDVVSKPKKARFVKGSPEAKAHFAKLRAMRKPSTGHKGHATKRGLAQDQKLVSKEEHEKSYQKIKRDHTGLNEVYK